MKHVMLFMPNDCAFDIIHRMGNSGIMQFDDLNGDITAFQRTYANYITKCQDLEQILLYFHSEIEAKNLILPVSPNLAKFMSKDAKKQDRNSFFKEKIATMTNHLGAKAKEVRQLNKVHKQLLIEFNQNRMLKYVIQEALKGYKQQIDPSTQLPMTETTNDYGEKIRFSRLTGVLNSDDQTAFERMVFRFSRGSCFLRFADIHDGSELAALGEDGASDYSPVLFEDPVTGKEVTKVVFTAVFVGSVLREKIKTICNAFNATIVEVPDAESVDAMATDQRNAEREMNDSDNLIKANRQRTVSILEDLTKNYYEWTMEVKCMKGVFHTLNKCRSENNEYVIAQGWLLADKMEYVQGLVHEIAGDSKGGALSEKRVTNAMPPTYFKTNKFTAVFQATVDIYGVPRYQEVNPALFTAVTFPFLFGVMYGDVGHGTLFTLFALYFVLNEKSLGKQQLGELTNMMFQGRYLLLLMGMFAVYCGFIYNEWFCLAMDIFGSKFTTNTTMDKFYTGGNRDTLWIQGGVEGYGREVYTFGVDPQWHMAKNELTFLNSFKMKLSVVLGITQMLAGILLKWCNAIYNRDDLTFIFECVPQVVFMVSLFVYMNSLIIYKWTIDWQEAFAEDRTAPSLINTMINMGLGMGSLGTEAQLYEGQESIQPVLFCMAILCIPLMLFPKPILLHKRNQAKHAKKDYKALGSNDEAAEEYSMEEGKHSDGGATKDADDEHHGEGHEEHGLMDLAIEQCIETIEFVLSCVSNTASYLRLWALSLAHAELAKTFWEMSMAPVINMQGSFGFAYVTVAYAMFAMSTVAVLMVMDPLECVLHALRLHWVEFQNKFYKADGVAFKPFCYKTILSVALSNGKE